MAHKAVPLDEHLLSQLSMGTCYRFVTRESLKLYDLVLATTSRNYLQHPNVLFPPKNQVPPLAIRQFCTGMFLQGVKDGPPRAT